MRRERIVSGATPCRYAGFARVLRAGFVLGLASQTACSSPGPTSPVNAPPSAGPSGVAAPAPTGATAKLQGTWELTKFESLGSMPDEAAPILGRLHGVVRLRIEGDQITTFVVGDANEEKCSFQVVDESGQNFTLVTSLGMFRRAKARFLSNEAWEATENGPTWPGTTQFTRVK